MACSNDKLTEANTSDVESEKNGGFLWKVSNGGTIMYLFGTIHLGKNTFFPLDPIVEKAFEQSDVVMPEINTNDSSMDQETLMKLAMFDDETTLDQVLSDELYRDLTVILKSYDLDIKNFHPFEPWLLDLMLLDFATAESNVDSAKSVDLYLLNKAEEMGKQIIPIESEDVQSKIFSSFTLETQVQTLRRTVQQFENLPKETEQSAEDWLNRDSEAFKQTRKRFDDAGINKEYFEQINDRRNIIMSQKLVQALQSTLDQTYFVFVGTFHVVLEPSLPTLLKKTRI